MRWNVVAPFFTAPDLGSQRWIDDFVDSTAHQFRKIAFESQGQRDWHRRAVRGTPFGGWLDYWKTSQKAMEGGDGVITVFPQLALMAAWHRRQVIKAATPIVAWCFNLGKFPRGAKRWMARAILSGVERFIVHSSGEVLLVAEYLDIAPGRVRFVPLQRAPIETLSEQDNESPFIVAMGSANRDYATLAEAARYTKLPVTIVAAPRVISNIRFPENVTLKSGLSAKECAVLAQRARFSVVPLTEVMAASGQVTVIEAQRQRRAVAATRSIGTVDYIRDGETGLLVPPGDPLALGEAMVRLWDDSELRERLAAGGADFAQRELSDEAAGRRLGLILDEVAGLSDRALSRDRV